MSAVGDVRPVERRSLWCDEFARGIFLQVVVASALVALAITFVWSMLGQLFRLVLLAAGVDDPVRSRVVAGAVLGVVVVLLVWGYAEAMRVPRVI